MITINNHASYLIEQAREWQSIASRCEHERNRDEARKMMFVYIADARYALFN